MAKTVRGIISILVLCVLFAPIFFVVGQNIESNNSTANLEIDGTDVLFDCEGCGVDVSDTELNGLIWGESLGWVNMQPSDGGVFNTRLGVLSGNAWGSVSGWVSFEGVLIDPETGEFSGHAYSQNRGHINFDCEDNACVITTWRPLGCTNPLAENYDETATVDDGSCVVIPTGCTDPSASNFDPLAEEDDGSCVFPPPPPPEDDENEGGGGGNSVEGCTDPSSNNFNPFATVDNGSCLYGDDIPGCMDPTSPLFDPQATVSDPSMCFVDLYGCMDPNALNYDPHAVIPVVESCEYEAGEEPILGCNVIYALNFNSLATQNDGSCVYDIPGNGCTNPLAINYDPNAVEDNGTCIFSIEELGDPDGEGEEGDENENGGEIGGGGDDSNPMFPFVDDVINGSEGMLIFKNSVEKNPLFNTALPLLFLLASLLQLLPFREGNLLFSFLSYYATKKYWGTVYDSVTKQPLDPAYVTLFDEAGQAVDTSITDIDGRYNFVVSPGTYFLSAQKTDYHFPSEKLKDKTYDELYAHLYFGGPIVIEKEDEVISRNIPMDPLRFNWNEYAKKKTKVTHFYRPWHRALIIASQIIFVLGFLWALIVFLVSPYLLSFVVLALYVVTVVLKLLGLRRIPRGYVKDKYGFALSYAVIRIYSETLHHEVKHAVTARGGHYLLLVPNGRYTMTVEHKQNDGSYLKVYESKPFSVRFGFIAKKITLQDFEIHTEEELFQKAFLANDASHNPKGAV